MASPETGWLLERDRLNDLQHIFSALRTQTARCQATLFPGIHPSVADFYDQTSRYDLQVWSAWRGPFRPFGWLLGVLFSRRLEQMNVPLDGLDTAWGMRSEVAHLKDGSGQLRYAVWRRVLRWTGRVLFVGYYSAVQLPEGAGVRIVFPLPSGTLTVLVKAEVGPAGRLLPHSHGRQFGGAGAYLTLAGPPHPRAIGRMIPLYEDIEVWTDGPSYLCTRYVLQLWRWTFLELHDLMRHVQQSASPVLDLACQFAV